MELLAGHVRWLFGEDGEKAAAQLDDVVGGSKMLLFRLARQRAFDVAGVVGADGRGVRRRRHRARLSGWLSPVRQVLEFERLTPEPGPDADAVAHEFVARCSAAEARRARGRRHRHRLGPAGRRRGRARRAGRCSSGTTVDVGAGEHEVRIVVHPLTELLDDAAHASRGSAGGRCWSRRRKLRWVRTQLLGRAPGFSPGPPVVGPYRPVTWSPDRLARLRAWLEGTTGRGRGRRRAAPRVPRRRALVAAHPRHAAAPRRERRRRGRGPGRLPDHREPLRATARSTSGSTACGSSAAARCGRPATWPRSTRRWRWGSTWSGCPASRRTSPTRSTPAATSSGCWSGRT